MLSMVLVVQMTVCIKFKGQGHKSYFTVMEEGHLTILTYV